MDVGRGLVTSMLIDLWENLLGGICWRTVCILGVFVCL
jgi:hypothetical protein